MELGRTILEQWAGHDLGLLGWEAASLAGRGTFERSSRCFATPLVEGERGDCGRM
jgi:hypothetical protein